MQAARITMRLASVTPLIHLTPAGGRRAAA
jgi:hypothetical protein